MSPPQIGSPKLENLSISSGMVTLPMQSPAKGFGGMYQEHALPKASRRLMGNGLLDSLDISKM